MTTQSHELEAIVRRIVGDVLAGGVLSVGLQSGEVQPTHEVKNRLCLTDRKVIALGDLEGKLDGKSEIATAPRAVITPAARDLLCSRSIQIVREDASKSPSRAVAASDGITVADADCPDRGAAFARQLGLRTGGSVQAVVVQEARIVLANLPQRVVCELCRSGSEAVQIGSLAEVRSVAAAMQPTVWVLDMNRLNLIAATNVAKQIAHNVN